jgi:hypothetical protein
MFTVLKKFFTDLKKFFTDLKKGSLYAVSYGSFKGNFFIFVETNKDGYGFLVTPDMKNIIVPVDEFDKGLECGIIEFVEILPKDVRAVVNKQYKDNVGNSNRVCNS